jgi:teichuronic acid biosynthesis glycosyltransferase TuaH
MLLHVDWNWIWQRPHALAAGLAARHDVRVIYRLNPYRRQLVRHPRGPSRWPLVPIPERAMPSLARAIHRTEISLLAKMSRPDVLWLTHPDLYQAVPTHLWNSCRVVYDCMDLATGFAADQSAKADIAQIESNLLRRADLILCSSEALLRNVRKQATTGRVSLLENGLDDRWTSLPRPAGRVTKQSSINAWYFGTVSHWIDWGLIAQALDQRPALRIDMAGPVESPPPIEHPRLRLHAPVEHTRLPEITKNADVFILPFVRNELVDHVNPVKLYEYLALRKPVVVVDYPETRKFLPWVNLYSSLTQFLALLDQVATSDADTQLRNLANEHLQQFLKLNTWSSRVEQVSQLLDSISNQ